MRTLFFLPIALIISGCAMQRTAGQPQDFQQAAAAPLYDINVLKTKIPVALIEAEERPYELPTPLNCRTIASAIAPLDDALGPDLDILPTENDPSALERSAEFAKGASVGLVRGGAQSILPFRGWVRVLTGAERNDRVVREAIVAGGVRRAFLKGLGHAQRCPVPAQPSAPALAGQDLDPPRPTREPLSQYPIR